MPTTPKRITGIPADERLYRVSELAERAAVSKRTIWRHIQKVALEVVRIGPHQRIRLTKAACRFYAGMADSHKP
jgi:excisionase family DNA binding protein